MFCKVLCGWVCPYVIYELGHYTVALMSEHRSNADNTNKSEYSNGKGWGEEDS